MGLDPPQLRRLAQPPEQSGNSGLSDTAKWWAMMRSMARWGHHALPLRSRGTRDPTTGFCKMRWWRWWLRALAVAERVRLLLLRRAVAGVTTEEAVRTLRERRMSGSVAESLRTLQLPQPPDCVIMSAVFTACRWQGEHDKSY